MRIFLKKSARMCLTKSAMMLPCEDVCKQEFIEEVMCRCPQGRAKDKAPQCLGRYLRKLHEVCDDIPENVTKEVAAYKTRRRARLPATVNEGMLQYKNIHRFQLGL